MKKLIVVGVVLALSVLAVVLLLHYLPGSATPEKNFDTAVKLLKSKNYKEAIEYFRKAAAQNHPRAQNYLGVMYGEGQGVNQDHKEAVKWFQKAAAQNYPRAQNNLGFMYKWGQGVNQDHKEAVKWYRKAVAQGHLGAKRALIKLRSQNPQ